MRKRHNILIIGGGGFIGSNLIKKIVNCQYYKIYVIESSRDSISKIDDFKDDIHIFYFKLINLQSIHSILTKYSINTIVHLVSNILPNCTFENYEKELANIVIPTIKLVNICSNLNIRFVYYSSGGAIYGNSIKQSFKETDVPSPISYYGLSKQIVEQSILFESAKNNLKFLIIRPSNPYGFGQDINGIQGFITVALGKILRNETILIRGNGSAVRDYIYIEDLANYSVELLSINFQNQIINVGSGSGHSINDVIKIVNQCSDYPCKVDYIASGPDDLERVVLDISKLKSIIDINTTPIEKGIRLFYNQLKVKY